MELREVEAFLVLAEELHFGRTAERLRLSQSRVSQLIQALERHIGVPLFERTSRRVTLTATGERLRDGLAPSYGQLHAVVAEVREATARPVLRIGFLGSAGGRPLTDLVERFRRERPEWDVIVAESPLVDYLEPLRRGDIDLLVTRLPVDQPGLTVGPVIARDERLLAVANDHPLAARSTASLEDLADHGVFNLRSSAPQNLTCPFVPLFTGTGRLIPRQHSFATYQEMLALVAEGKGVHPIGASLLRFHRHPEVRFLPITDLPPADVALVQRDGDDNPAVGTFTKLATAIAC